MPDAPDAPDDAGAFPEPLCRQLSEHQSSPTELLAEPEYGVDGRADDYTTRKLTENIRLGG